MDPFGICAHLWFIKQWGWKDFQLVGICALLIQPTPLFLQKGFSKVFYKWWSTCVIDFMASYLISYGQFKRGWSAGVVSQIKWTSRKNTENNIFIGLKKDKEKVWSCSIMTWCVKISLFTRNIEKIENSIFLHAIIYKAVIFHPGKICIDRESAVLCAPSPHVIRVMVARPLVWFIVVGWSLNLTHKYSCRAPRLWLYNLPWNCRDFLSAFEVQPCSRSLFPIFFLKQEACLA